MTTWSTISTEPIHFPKPKPKGPNKHELKARRPQPGVGLLGAAVLVAHLHARQFGHLFNNVLDESHYFDKLYAPATQLMNKVTKVMDTYEPAGECDCGTEFGTDEPEYDCEECSDVVCRGCFHVSERMCDGCYEMADRCGSCDEIINDGTTYYCEHCNVTRCDDCIISGEWDNYEYLCSSCADDGVGHHEDEPQFDTTIAPWISRGVQVQSLIRQIFDDEDEAEEENAVDSTPWGQRWKEMWGFDDAEHDPAQAAADFYLLHPIQFNSLAPAPTTELRVLAEEGRALREELIARYDQVFRGYIDMVVGGELRHHSAIMHEALDEERSYAWVGWKKIREAVGPAALLDAAALFREFGGRHVSVGGENWAVVAEVLHLRETRQISPEVFVDRVFNLEHNGGSILSAKVSWSGFFKWNHTCIQQHIGPAHAAHPARLDILAIYASADTARLWGEYVPVLNQQRRLYGQHPIRRLPAREKPSRHAYNRIQHDVSMALQMQAAVTDVRTCRGGHHPNDIDHHASFLALQERKKEGTLKPYDL